MWGWHDGPNGSGWFWMALMMALVWVPLILGGIWLARALRRSGEGPDAPQRHEVDARELARRAYARGEIDRERFIQMMADLDQTERPSRAG